MLPFSDSIRRNKPVLPDSFFHRYACVATCAYVTYLRITVKKESRYSLIAAKTKVAHFQPIHSLLETASCLDGMPPAAEYLRSSNNKYPKTIPDSATVLAWLRCKNRRYYQFISFRVEKIMSFISVNEWRYAPSRGNVADDATKWNLGSLFDPYCRWYQGPPFLQDPENQWLTE